MKRRTTYQGFAFDVALELPLHYAVKQLPATEGWLKEVTWPLSTCRSPQRIRNQCRSLGNVQGSVDRALQVVMLEKVGSHGGRSEIMSRAHIPSFTNSIVTMK
jgi:hypothetical protein